MRVTGCSYGHYWGLLQPCRATGGPWLWMPLGWFWWESLQQCAKERAALCLCGITSPTSALPVPHPAPAGFPQSQQMGKKKKKKKIISCSSFELLWMFFPVPEARTLLLLLLWLFIKSFPALDPEAAFPGLERVCEENRAGVGCSHPGCPSQIQLPAQNPCVGKLGPSPHRNACGGRNPSDPEPAPSHGHWLGGCRVLP